MFMFSWSSIVAWCVSLAVGLCAVFTPAAAAAIMQAGTSARTLPRTADGKPNLQGIWQVRNRAGGDLQDHAAKEGMPAGRSVVEGGEIPYQPWAASKKLENFAHRKTADPLAKCYFPGVPRIMYMEFPFHIFQTRDHVAITFEWSQVFRLIYTNGEPVLHSGIESWMGDSRGRWEGDTLVVDVTGPEGKVVSWAFEMNATNGLLRRGWRKEDLPAGTVLVIDGYQARNGAPVANATSITFTDGRRLFAGSPNAPSQP
jgi:hypothetical protein